MKNSTFLMCSFVLVMFVSSLLDNPLNAQITKTVAPSGGDYTNILTAITTELPNIPDNGTLTVNVAEGSYEIAATTNMNWPAKKIDIVVQGAGAGKTIQKSISGLEARIDPETSGLRWLQITNATGVTTGTGSITFKDMTFQYLGAYKLVAAAGCVVNCITDATITAKFENIEFNNCVGSSIINSPKSVSTIVLENCLFKECVGTPRRDNNNDMLGLVNKTGGTLIIKNTVFHSNENGDVDSPTPSNGFAVNVSTLPLYPSVDVILENNAFVNNKNVVTDYVALSSVISFKPGIEATAFNVTMNNNILVGNQRAGQANDVDLQVVNSEKLTWVASAGNILSKAVKSTATPGEYEPYTFAGSKIDNTYTFTDPRINFIMDGTLPKLTADSKGIGKVEYTGDGGSPLAVKVNKNANFKAYVSNKTLIVEGLNVGSTVEIYSITGALVSKNINQSDRFQMKMQNGIYLLRSGNSSLKVIVQ